MPSQCPIRESSLEGWLAKSATLVQSPCDPVDGLLPLPAGDRGERHVSDKAAPKDNIGFKVSQPGETGDHVQRTPLRSLANGVGELFSILCELPAAGD